MTKLIIFILPFNCFILKYETTTCIMPLNQDSNLATCYLGSSTEPIQLQVQTIPELGDITILKDPKNPNSYFYTKLCKAYHLSSSRH